MRCLFLHLRPVARKKMVFINQFYYHPLIIQHSTELISCEMHIVVGIGDKFYTSFGCINFYDRSLYKIEFSMSFLLNQKRRQKLNLQSFHSDAHPIVCNCLNPTEIVSFPIQPPAPVILSLYYCRPCSG